MKLLIVVALAIANTTALRLHEENTQGAKPSAIKHDARIAGGEDADTRKFNYQVGIHLIVMESNMDILYWCGGSLIAHNWVLTAAHCTESTDRMIVYLGSANRARAEAEFYIVRSDVNIIEHELWNNKTMVNDIALIRIPNIKYTKNILPIHLAQPGSDDNALVDTYATVSGWGRMSENATKMASHLQSVTLRIISNSECVKDYEHVFDGNICVATGDDDVMRSPCPGDSGGSLVMHGTNIQIGVTSYGDIMGCERGSPVVFARVSYYIDWITANTGIKF